MNPSMSALEWLRQTEVRLQASGSDAAHLDARWLLGHLLELDGSDLLRQAPELVLETSTLSRLESLVSERERGVPLAYLLEEWEFYGLTLTVNSDVLVPRPESELLVDWGIELLKNRPSPRIADIGTGSGCLALALAQQLPETTVDAVDLSEAALRVARRNVEQHQLKGRIQLFEGDLLSPLASLGQYDLIVSNPPYIADGDPRLEQSVRQFEPAIALYEHTGLDGLNFYRRLLAESPDLLQCEGKLLIELPEDGADAISTLGREQGWESEVRRDLANIERVISFTRKE